MIKGAEAMSQDLWKYCTLDECHEFLLSFNLFGQTNWSKEKQLACLYTISNQAEKYYQPFSIEKRDGTQRQLLAPKSILKKIQQNILHRLLEQIPVSQYATAYCKTRDILSNATPHIGKQKILKLDIEDFFGSILFSQVRQHAFPTIYYPLPVGTLLSHLCCYDDVLPQGAPTSATISNLVMRPFDEFIGKWCLDQRITYTRYCDDMTFSGDFDVKIVKRKVQNFLEAIGFSLNEEKTKVLTQHQKQTVTGIVVNQKAQVPLNYRKKLRQELYYCGKFGVKEHLARETQQSAISSAEILRYLHRTLGKINFVLQVNAEDLYFQEARRNVQKQLMIYRNYRKTG